MYNFLIELALICIELALFRVELTLLCVELVLLLLKLAQFRVNLLLFFNKLVQPIRQVQQVLAQDQGAQRIRPGGLFPK